jgi:hypothetical protein
MAITLTNIHKRRLISQIEQNLTGLQRDMHNNAVGHRAMAVAQNPAAAELRGYMDDCANTYLARLQWIIGLRNAPERRQRLVDMLATVGWTEQEIVDYVTELRNAAIALRDATKNNYAQIIAACDAMLAAVDMPESLWPE